MDFHVGGSILVQITELVIVFVKYFVCVDSINFRCLR